MHKKQFIKDIKMRARQKHTNAIVEGMGAVMSEPASYDTENAAYILEKGDYVLRLGVNSAETAVCGIAKLDADVTVRKVHHIGGTPDFADWKPQNPRQETLPDHVPVVTVSASDIRTETVKYDVPQEIAPEIKALSDEELAYINVGAFDPRMGPLNFMPAPVAFLSRLISSKPKKGSEILHQYATAIPIGTAMHSIHQYCRYVLLINLSLSALSASA